MLHSKVDRLVEHRDLGGLLAIALDTAAHHRGDALSAAFQLLGDEPRASPDSPVVAAACRQLVGDTDRTVRGLAIGGLCAAGDPDCVPLAIAALSDAEGFVRSQALLGLGFVRDSSCIPRVLPLLDDSDHTVRAFAAGTLGRMGDRSVISDLESRDRVESNKLVKKVIGDAIAELSNAPDEDVG